MAAIDDSDENGSHSVESTPVTFKGAIITLFSVFAILIVGALILEVDIALLLMTAAIFTSVVFVFYYGFSWDELMEKGAVPLLSKAMGAFLILLVVGILIGIWMVSGTIPYLMYLGLHVLSPAYFLIASVIILSIATLLTGTSFGSVATFGVALIGVASGLGMPLAPTAGAILVGAIFGDKLSPISDTTILASAVAQNNLIDHIESTLYTTVPGYLLSLAVFFYVGRQYASGTVEAEEVTTFIQTIDQTFILTPILLVPPLILFVLSYMRYPTIPVMWTAIVAAIPLAVYQGFGPGEIATAMATGPEITTSVDELNSLLQLGGVQYMASIVVILFFAYLFAGQLEYAGVFEIITVTLRDNFVGDSRGRLILSTSATGMFTALGTGNTHLSEIVPGLMYRDSFDEMGIDRSVLSRTLEDSGTVFTPLIPWSAAGLYFSNVLGVPTLSYAPWAIMCYTSFILAWVYGFANLFIFSSASSTSDDIGPKKMNQDD